MMDINTVFIETNRLEELIRADEKIRIIKNAYQSLDIYGIETVLEAVFGLANEYEEEPKQSPAIRF